MSCQCLESIRYFSIVTTHLLCNGMARTVRNVSGVIRICVIYLLTWIFLQDKECLPMYTLAEFTQGPRPFTYFGSRRYQQLNSLRRNNHPLQVFIGSKHLKCNQFFWTISNFNAGVFWTDPSQARLGGWRDICLRLVAVKPQRILLAPDLDSMKRVERISDDSC